MPSWASRAIAQLRPLTPPPPPRRQTRQEQDTLEFLDTSEHEHEIGIALGSSKRRSKTYSIGSIPERIIPSLSLTNPGHVNFALPPNQSINIYLNPVPIEKLSFNPFSFR